MNTKLKGMRALRMRLVSLTALLLFTGAAVADTANSTYKTRCAACHGTDGKGATAAGKAMGVNDLTSDAVQKMSDADLVQAISAGKGKMPAYGKTLKDSDIKDLVTYIRAFDKK